MKKEAVTINIQTDIVLATVHEQRVVSTAKLNNSASEHVVLQDCQLHTFHSSSSLFICCAVI